MTQSNTGAATSKTETHLALQRALQGKDDLLASIPAIPAVLRSLLDELDQPAERVNLARVAEILGRDEALAAQCLRMANSVLFSRGPAIDSLRGAVRTLGIVRTREIAMACGLMRVMPSGRSGLDPLVFWQHSLGCAIVSRKLARSVGYGDPDKAYLAGLLHDIGYIVNLVVLPKETNAALEKARNQGRFMGDLEREDLGFTHCESGELLARQWRLADGLVEVIVCHHSPADAIVSPALTAIIGLSDRLCRAANLGLGYAEGSSLDEAEADWNLLLEKCPMAAEMSWDDFVKESDRYVEDIHKLVTETFRNH
jgi:putative nucleotidyltransferase with HDIG domain